MDQRSPYNDNSSVKRTRTRPRTRGGRPPRGLSLTRHPRPDPNEEPHFNGAKSLNYLRRTTTNPHTRTLSPPPPQASARTKTSGGPTRSRVCTASRRHSNHDGEPTFSSVPPDSFWCLLPRPSNMYNYVS